MIPAIAAAMLLFVALGRHPYGYYTFLRWAICAAGIVVAWVAWHSLAQWITWPFVAIAILFNPLVPVYLQRSTWRPIDILCGLAFLGATTIERREHRPRMLAEAPDRDLDGGTPPRERT
jgi:hypothetical protein